MKKLWIGFFAVIIISFVVWDGPVFEYIRKNRRYR